MTKEAQYLGKEPINPIYNEENRLIDAYLTKREYFAGLAMQGIVNDMEYPPMNLLEQPKNIAKWAVLFSDSLLEELSKL
jgi:beta-galactosidase GanA